MTTNSHAKLLERYLSLICDGDPEARRLGYGAWFRRYGGASLAVGTMLALAGCGDGSQKDESLTSGGGESSVGGDIQSAAGLGQGGAAASQGGSAGTGRGGAAAQQGGAPSFGGVAGSGQGGAIGRGGSAGTGQGGSGTQQGGAQSLGGAAGSGLGGAPGEGGTSAAGQAGEEQGGTSGAAQGGQEQGGSAGAAQGGQEPSGGTAGAGLGGSGEGGLVWTGGTGMLYGVPIETNCGNGRDDDFDGATDCGDPDCMSMMSCAADYAVPMEVCDDRVDNDYDGATDCDDINCAGDPSCEGNGGAGGGGGAGGNGGEGGATTDGIYVTLSAMVSEECLAATERTLILHNDTLTDVFLPGCANYYIDNGSGNRAPNAVCTTEGIGRVVPARGTFDATYRCPDAAGTITLCFEVSYGCTPDLPLSQAGCTGSEWFCAEPFTLFPLP